MSINFFAEGTDFLPEDQTTIRKWVTSVITDKQNTTGTINYIFCSDDYLLSLNKQYLDHDTYTDIITFDYAKDGVISGDIFISVDRVRDNAIKFKQSFTNELYRVIVHGILHLCGLKDKTDEEFNQMRNQEDYYLKILSK